MQFVDGMTVLQYYSLDGINMWAWLGIECIFVVVFFVLAFLALTYVRHVRRRPGGARPPPLCGALEAAKLK